MNDTNHLFSKQFNQMERLKLEYKEVTTPSVASMRPPSPLPVIKSEEDKVELPSLTPPLRKSDRLARQSPRSNNPLRKSDRLARQSPRSNNPLRKSARLARQSPRSNNKATHTPKRTKYMKKKGLPSKYMLNKRTKEAIKKYGYNLDTHFQRLLSEDSKLPSESKTMRWCFALRFCVLSNKKINANARVYGEKHGKQKTALSLIPGLREFLKLKNVYIPCLEKPVSSGTVTSFISRKYNKDFSEFLHTLYTLLYAFLHETNLDTVNKLTANVTTNVEEEEEIKSNEVEIKEEEMDLDLKNMNSDAVTEYDKYSKLGR